MNGEVSLSMMNIYTIRNHINTINLPTGIDGTVADVDVLFTVTTVAVP